MEPVLEEQRKRLIGMILPDAKFTAHQAAEAAGMDLESAQRVWRALGMPNVDDDKVWFSDSDIEALELVTLVLSTGLPLDDVVTLGRLVGRAMSRVTDAQTRLIRDRLVEPLIASGADPDSIGETIEPVIKQLLELFGKTLEYTYRRHLVAAIEGLSDAEHEPTERLAAGFVDLVGFSKVSDDLSGAELDNLISLFEELVMRICADNGVRLVKIIGDSAMFVSHDPVLALDVAIEIVQKVQADPLIPGARAGIDFGPVLPRGGDYFGRPVNVAARMTEIAREGSIVASQGLLQSLPPDHVVASRLPPRRLKNVGRVSMFRIKEVRGDVISPTKVLRQFP